MIIISSIILGISIITAAGVLSRGYTYIYANDKELEGLKKSKEATDSCLKELVDKLNEVFTGSTLQIKESEGSVKVIGEIK